MNAPASIRPAAPRRGVSMLMVLLSLAMATILTTAFLASRDNSTAIGGNIASASTSRWAAVSGLQLGEAIMQTDTGWRTADPMGVLLDDHPIGAATVDLVVVDAVTGKPPTEQSTTFLLTSTATHGDVRQVATATATVHPVDPVADVDLSEFTIFAKDRVQMVDRSIVTRWPMSPLNDLGQPLAIGTQNTSAGGVLLMGDAAAVDTTVFHGPGASGSLVMSSNGPAIDQSQVGGTIPMPQPPSPGVTTPGGALPAALDVSAASVTITSAEWHYPDVSVATAGTLTLDGDATLVSHGDLNIAGGGTLQVDGASTVVVNGDLTLDGGSILLADDATLDLYVDGVVTLVNGYIGNATDAGADLDPTGHAEWMDPERIHIFGNDADVDAGWSMTGTSVVKANLYSPSGQITIADQSAVYGRLAADRVSMYDDAAVFYDHTMDSGSGYTQESSALFDGNGSILSSFSELGALGVADLAEVADRTNLAVTAYGKTYFEGAAFEGDFVPAVGGEIVAPPDPETPTPRPARVEFDFGTIGSSILAWEQGAS